MKDFVAIDFETANYQRSSICSIGIVVVRAGIIVDRQYRLVRPEPNYYNSACVAVHGLNRKDTDTSPTFPEVWRELIPYMAGLPLVAHNKSFDESCLRAVYHAYGMSYDMGAFYCTLSSARRALRGELSSFELPVVARYYGFNLEAHHHALADAEACAHIALHLPSL